MSIDRELDEELQRLFNKIEALREYLGVNWIWDYDEIIGAKKKEEESKEEEDPQKRLNILLDEAIKLVEKEYDDYYGLEELIRIKRYFNGEEK